MFLPENTPILFTPTITKNYQMQYPQVTLSAGSSPPRSKHPSRCLLSDLGDRSSGPVVEYINSLSDGHPPANNPRTDSPLTPNPQTRGAMTSTATASQTAEAILSNQYRRRMQKNRPQWYTGKPLDTAPRCFSSNLRYGAHYISDWREYYGRTATLATQVAHFFSDKYYKINGVIWTWEDPASSVLVGLSVSDTVEFAISSDPFCAPHIVVTHSPGNEPQCLDTHGNPDQLTETQPRSVPNQWGCTPRQSFVGPTGKDQLLLPPRMYVSFERDDYTQLCAAATINRRNVLLRLSIQFHEGMRRIRERRKLKPTSQNLELPERGRQLDCKDISIPAHAASDISDEPDFEPMSQAEIKASGFSDIDAAESLFTRCGIIFQPQLDDLTLLAESAVFSDEGEDDSEEEEEESSQSVPHSPTVGDDTFEVLRRLGMVHCDSMDGEDSEDGASEDGEEDGDDEDEDEDEDEEDYEYEYESEGDEDEDTTGHLTIPDTKIPASQSITDSGDLTPSSWAAKRTALPVSTGSLNLASMLHRDADEEQSSVSSLFAGEDQDSVGSDCETPDTEDEC